MDLFSAQSSILLLISVAMFAVKAFALIDAVARPTQKFAAVETLPKNSWLIILGLTVVSHLLLWDPIGILNLIGIVAALVYLAQVRGSSS